MSHLSSPPPQNSKKKTSEKRKTSASLTKPKLKPCWSFWICRSAQKGGSGMWCEGNTCVLLVTWPQTAGNQPRLRRSPSGEIITCSVEKTFEGWAGAAWARRDHGAVKPSCDTGCISFSAPPPDIWVFRQTNSVGSAEVTRSQRRLLPSCWESCKRLAWHWPVARRPANGREKSIILQHGPALPFHSQI